VAALWRRAQTGAGCFLDIAIVDGPAFLMAMEYDYLWNTGHARRRGDTHLSGGYPWYHLFATADGRHLSVAAVEPQFYKRLCALIGRADLATRQYADGEAREELFAAFRAIFKSRRCDEWMKLLGDEDVCVAPVCTAAEAVDALRDRASGVISAGGDRLAVRSPVRLPAAPSAGPTDSAATLARFGFSEDEIDALRSQGVIAS